MATIDVTVHGAGIFGLSCAWALVERGARVRVVDPYGVGAGASGGVVGALAPHTPDQWDPKKAFQFKSLMMAAAFWKHVENAGGLAAGYARTGRLQPLADDRAVALARARITAAEQNWGTDAVWQVIPATDDWMPPSPSGHVIHDSLTARIHPAQACAALAAALAARGAEVVNDAPDQGQILWATGIAGLTDLSARFDKMVGNGVKGQAALFALDRRDQPQLFADSLHIVPHADGTTAVGSTSERYYSDTATDAQLDDVIARARAACPALGDAPVIQRWANIRPRAKTRAPLLGAWPDRAGHYIANGGFKIGFGVAPLVAQVMADLMLTGEDNIPPDFTISTCI